MISTNNVTLRVGKKALFEDVTIKFTEGNCYGLIGANGAGKSTFLKILSGQLEPTNGDVVITPGERLSFLQQDHFKYDEYMVLDTVIMGNARLYEIMKEKEALYAKEDFTDEDGMKASELEREVGMDWMSQDLAARLSTRAAQGIGAGLLTARLGIKAMELCRPLPWIDDDKPRLGDFRRQLIGQVKETLQKGKTPSEK